VTALERHCRWLPLAYPAWYRRERAEEMLGTVLEATPPGRRWPTFRDTRAPLAGGLRARGWAWLVSILWIGAGAVLNGYVFYLSTMPLLPEDTGVAGWTEISAPLKIVIAVALVVFLAALIPAPIAGVHQASRLAARQLVARRRLGRRVEVGQRGDRVP
jgi:hypothetical protein